MFPSGQVGKSSRSEPTRAPAATPPLPRPRRAARPTPGSALGGRGAVDGEVPVAARDVQRPDAQEEGGPFVGVVGKAGEARARRDGPAEDAGGTEGAQVAVLQGVD